MVPGHPTGEPKWLDQETCGDPSQRLPHHFSLADSLLRRCLVLDWSPTRSIGVGFGMGVIDISVDKWRSEGKGVKKSNSPSPPVMMVDRAAACGMLLSGCITS